MAETTETTEQQVSCQSCESRKQQLLSVDVGNGQTELNLLCMNCGALQILPIKGEPDRIVRKTENKKSTYLQ